MNDELDIQVNREVLESLVLEITKGRGQHKIKMSGNLFEDSNKESVTMIKARQGDVEARAKLKKLYELKFVEVQNDN